MINMVRKKRTTETFGREVHDLTDGHYKLLGEYQSMNTKVLIIHLDCNTVYKVTPSHFIYDHRRCPKCSLIKKGKKRLKSNEEFLDEVRQLYGNKYVVLSAYKRSNIKVKVKCNICNNIFYIRPNSLLRHHGCPVCAKLQEGLNERLSESDFKERLSVKFARNIVPLTHYETKKKPVKFKCLRCGFIWSTTPDIILRSPYGCPRCGKIAQSKKSSKGLEAFKKQVYLLTGATYKVLDEHYANNKIKIKMKHLICGHVYFVTPHNFLRGRRCPFCKTSKLENNVRLLLNSLSIKYDEHKRFDWLRYHNHLQHLDFYIPSKRLAIECDGEQHYKPVDFAGKGEEWADKQLKENQLRDFNKNRLCDKHCIKIVRIPYTKFPLSANDMDNFLSGD